MIIPTSQATDCHAMRVMSSSRARSRWFSWTSRTSLMVLCWKPISLNWARRRRNSAACNRVQQSYIHQSDSNFVPVTLFASMLRSLWWTQTPKPPAGETSPCSHSSGTSPGLRPPGPRRNPAHTDDLGTAGISGSTSNITEQIYFHFCFFFFFFFFWISGKLSKAQRFHFCYEEDYLYLIKRLNTKFFMI